jgi:hypothetical protein
MHIIYCRFSAGKEKPQEPYAAAETFEKIFLPQTSKIRTEKRKRGVCSIWMQREK